MLTDAQRAVLGPLVEACRPRAKVPPRNLRRTISAEMTKIYRSSAAVVTFFADLGLTNADRGTLPVRGSASR